MKVKFCSHGIVSVEAHGGASINPAWLYMQKWYELHGKNPNLVWLPPGVLLTNIDHSLQDIINSEPDILGLGVYVWNDELQHYIARKVKEQLPNTLIVLGGPNLTVHKDFENESNSTDYFKKHPYVDYVVYGDGEKPFQQIIDYHGGFITSKEHFVNIVENCQGQGTCYPYEMISDELYLSQSPYASQEQHMREMRDRFVEQGIELSEQKWLIEFARGCMYSCTFCDWAQNLSKKVKRRKHDWKLDIDVLYRLNVKVRTIDANFGQWSDDVKAFDYACSLKDSSRNFNFPAINLSKLKKDVCEYLIIQNGLVWGVPPKISIQDPMEDVLTAINRPSVSWEALSKMILNIKAAIPPELFGQTVMETILGLPEQTLNSIAESYLKYYELGIVTANYHPWTILPNSPAADPNYQKVWGIKTKTIHELMNFELDVDDLANLYHQLSQDTSVEKINFVQMPIVVEHRKMSFIDILAAKIMATKWQDFNYKFNVREKFSNDQVRALFVKLKNDAIIEATAQYNLHKEYIDKYNFVVWGKYNPDTKKMTRL
jgi:radical SAM superfamily enzyme YgiQ (UPF0313 family)